MLPADNTETLIPKQVGALQIAVSAEVRYADHIEFWTESAWTFPQGVKREQVTFAPTYSAAWSGPYTLKSGRWFYTDDDDWHLVKWWLVIVNNCGQTTTTPTRNYWIKQYDPPSNVLCNNCSPKLRETYVVTLSGLTGGLAAYNGSHTVSWQTACIWSATVGPSTTVSLQWTGSGWSAGITSFAVTCSFTKAGAGYACYPTGGTYTCFSCSGGCGGKACTVS